MKHLTLDQLPAALKRLRRPYQADYYAMYSSLLGGIVTDPVMMLIPLDDHMVHRGDGIFEVFKCVNGNIYNLKAHLERLKRSAKRLDIRLPCSLTHIQQHTIETLRAGKHRDAYVHLYVSRGPGSFGVSPHDCPETQLYIVAVHYKKPFMELHPDGARVAGSTVAAGANVSTGVKSCSYLVNALMKKEASSLKVDFVIGFDANDNLTEGATENVGVVTKDGHLRFPKLDGILCGTTMVRVMALAKKLVRSGELRGVSFCDIPRSAVTSAREILIVGTTPNVTFVRQYDGKIVGRGGPGPVYQRLSQLLQHDMTRNPSMLTSVF
jgi:branched-subunit amino acid aminotransferase/4-amino-4-deoxychorismate lyase